MSYNIRLDVASDGPNAWPERRDFLASQVRYHAPVVVGIQEGLPQQVAWLNEHLKDYSYVGEGRDGGDRGEYSALFYQRQRLVPVRSGTFWLSPTPEVPSKGWDAALNRICTWAEFKDRVGGHRFMVFNTHFDHVGEVARQESAELLLAAIDSLNPKDLAFVLMGDLNLEPHSAPIQHLNERLTDAFTAAPLRLGPTGTFTGFDYTRPASRRIDYIFIGNLPKTAVRAFATLSDAVDGRYPSDHFPVSATLHLRPRPKRP
ncbi:endonuclease/exonuclease/phosphatase family protein [Lewinella lacunae]|uniref:Endonuclease/exonuclease/phosphatase family protein n=2 Tax=Neolewinella lacunae TaxID=1517758 RepID=A0A923T7Q7_9BACT|nr:endonuclease/exonuclease/phosphatase family protein [Neolewinella lacunae]